MTPTNWFAADTSLHRKGSTARLDSRKVANNTYLIRRGEDIALRLHNTDVVTFLADRPKIRLNTGGWFTVTTKSRINSALPGGFGVYSIKGRWHLIRSGMDPVPFVDGMILDPDTGKVDGVDEDAVKAEDDANTKIRKAIDTFVRATTAEEIVRVIENTGGDCFGCRFGDDAFGTDHLALHIGLDPDEPERYLQGHMILNAVKAAGYHNPDLIMHLIYRAAQAGTVDQTFYSRTMRKYLRKSLLTGVAVA